MAVQSPTRLSLFPLHPWTLATAEAPTSLRYFNYLHPILDMDVTAFCPAFSFPSIPHRILRYVWSPRLCHLPWSVTVSQTFLLLGGCASFEEHWSGLRRVALIWVCLMVFLWLTGILDLGWEDPRGRVLFCHSPSREHAASDTLPSDVDLGHWLMWCSAGFSPVPGFSTSPHIDTLFFSVVLR